MSVEEVLISLENLDYLTVGGAAVIMYGVDRNTFDLDIIIPYYEVSKILEIFKGLGYTRILLSTGDKEIDDVSKDDIINDYGARFLGKFPVDVIVFDDTSLDNWNLMYNRRLIYEIKDIKVKVANKKDVIFLKRLSGREQDLQDVADLLKVDRGQKYE